MYFAQTKQTVFFNIVLFWGVSTIKALHVTITNDKCTLDVDEHEREN